MAGCQDDLDLRHRADRAKAVGLPRRRRRGGRPRHRRRRNHLRRLRRRQAVRARARRKDAAGRSRPAATCARRRRWATACVYVGSFDSQLYAVKLDGTLAWTFRAGDRIVSSPLVDARGAILFGSQDDRLYCLEPDGHLRWSVELGGDVDSSPTLAADGTIFVGSDDRKLYALRAPAGASAARRNRNAIDSRTTLRAGPASRACPHAISLVASRSTPPATASSSPTTSPRTSTSPRATAAPRWTPTPSRSRPGPACAASKGASCRCSRAAAPRSPASSRARGRSRCSSPTIRASPRPVHAASGRSPSAPRRHRRGRRDHPLPRRARRADRGARSSRCSAIPTIRAPRSRRSSPAPTSRASFPTTSRASPTARRPRCATTICVDRIDLRDVRSRPSIPRPRATSTTRSAIETAAARRHARCGSRSPTSRTTCARARRSTRGAQPRLLGLPARPRDPDAAASRCRRDICSLNPEVDRCAMVVRIDVDRHGAAGRPRTSARRSSARSARLDYPGVAAALGGDFRGARASYEPFLPDAARDGFARAAAARRARIARGALDFDLPEPFVELDDDDPRLVRDVVQVAARSAASGRPTRSSRSSCSPPTRRSRATSASATIDTVWRVHDVPDRASGSRSSPSSPSTTASRSTSRTAAHPAGSRACSTSCRASPPRRRCHFLLLRSLKQAIYDVVNVGHFGLASADYLHFTSPIRRYPDLIVHRLLKSAAGGQGCRRAGASRRRSRRRRPRRRCRRWPPSRRSHERRAMEVEREVVDLYRAFLMRDRIGEEFDGTISGVTGFGLFVGSTIPFVEGLVRVDALATTTTTSTSRPAGWSAGARGARSRSATRSRSRCSRSASCAARSTSRWPGTRRAHHDAGDEFGRGDKRGRRDKPAAAEKRQEKHDKAEQRGRARPTAVRKRARQAARQRRRRKEPRRSRGRQPPAGQAEEAAMTDPRDSWKTTRSRILSPFAQRSRASKGRGAARAARSGAAHLPARSRSHHPLEGVPAARRQDPGVPGARGRPLPDAHHPHARGGADRAHGDARARPQRIADRGDRDGPRSRPHAVRPRGREGARAS